jgi:hypothetical protein
MDEIGFTKALVEQLQPSFPDYELETRISIFYSLYIDEDGNIPINQNEKGEPIRGNGTGFEQDILLYERVSGQTSIVPRVAIEVKFGGVTTHDAIVYSEKARKVRNVYPYLRYGFLIGDVATLPPRLLRLGADFDFILRASNPPLDKEKDQLIELLKEEIGISKKLGNVFSGATSVMFFRRKVIIEPEFESLIKTTKSIIQSAIPASEEHIEISNQKTYFVYENWTAEKKAVIHFGDCSYCNYGQGIHPDHGSHNGCWHGPFATFAIAEKEARETGKPVRFCRICAPG